MFNRTDHYDFQLIFNSPHNTLQNVPHEYINKEHSRFRYHGMYALIENDWVIPLASWIKNLMKSGDWECKEIMAGRGWLARALSDQDVEIEASDSGQDHAHRTHELEYPDIITDAVYEVDKKSAIEVSKEIISEKQENPQKRFVIIICYPPEEGRDATDFVNNLPEDTLIIYIGDDEFINTADESFRDAIIWLHENPNHSESYLLKGFPLKIDVEGVGSDETDEDTVMASILLGTPKL
ncbi:hypothetical protein [Priestia flexa]|uniref:hypothetical protein n=1 Tax=Priestia flexa TaxID=86664 RepID=UPI0024925AEC|nr:hypothetical protein [Priestia flexa]